MNDNFKNQLAAFARDVKAICDANPHTYQHCPLSDADGCCKGVLMNSIFDPDAVIAAVEAYRKRRKPCAEVIDRAVDIYTIEVEVERIYPLANEPIPVKEHADFIATFLRRQMFNGTPLSAAVRVLSAKRYVLESHRED